MADLEAVLADVSYLMAMEKSKSTPAARASKKIILPDPRYKLFGDLSMHKWYKIHPNWSVSANSDKVGSRRGLSRW